MKQIVKPIKDFWVLHSVQESLLKDFDLGCGNYTIFQTGKATLPRISDALQLKKSGIYDERGRVRRNAYIIDRKTKKPNTFYLNPIGQDLENYYDWSEEWQKEHPTQTIFYSPWLFPSFKCPGKHIDEWRYYMIMYKVGKKLNIDYLGTHAMRKTGACCVYEQTNHDIALVMKLFNHFSEDMILAYLGLDQEAREHILDVIGFE